MPPRGETSTSIHGRIGIQMILRFGRAEHWNPFIFTRNVENKLPPTDGEVMQVLK